jgi:uncharacterized protein (TIGR03437 family)
MLDRSFLRRVLLPGAGFFLLFGIASAQTPLIYSRSIYNAASYTPAGLPGGGIAQGSLFSLFGTNLGPTAGVSVNAFPLQTTLGGTSISIVQGATTVAAIPVYVGASQINAIMPSNAPLGAASVQITYNGHRSNFAPVRIVTTSFGVYTALGTGLGPAIVQNFINASTQPVNSTTAVAQPGQSATLWGTGLGPIQAADNIAPPVGNIPNIKVEVFVGGVSAPVLYSGRAPCCSGSDQVVFTIPTNAPTGCWVPIYVRTNGTAISNFVTMAIGPGASTCTTDVLPQITAGFIGAKSIGQAFTMRAATHHDVGVRSPIDTTADYHVSFAFAPHDETFLFNPAISFPPSGTCTVYTHQGDLLGGDMLPSMEPTTMPLDMGAPFLLTGPNGTKTLTSTFTGANAGYLGGAVSSLLSSTLFLDPGSYTVQGFGGLGVGPFTTNFTIPTPLNWTNRLTTTTVPRTQPLSVSWTGGDSGQVVAIVGFGEDLPTASSAVFACIAPKGANSFTVPTDILANLPATRPNPLQSKDIIYVLTLAGSSVETINATGLDVGLTSFFSILGKTVVLQ